MRRFQFEATELLRQDRPRDLFARHVVVVLSEGVCLRCCELMRGQ